MAVKLFVGGLSWDTTDDSLKNFFASAGTVVTANVIKDKYTGKSRGFGFVEMSTAEEAEEAKKLNGQALDGRNISVNEASQHSSLFTKIDPTIKNCLYYLAQISDEDIKTSAFLSLEFLIKYKQSPFE